MKAKRALYLLLALAGLALLLAAIFVFPGEEQKKAAGACYGIGAAVLVLGSGWFFGTFSKVLNSAEVKKQKDIAVNDERNVMIREKAGAMTERYTTYTLILWIMLEGVLGGDLLHILLLTGFMLLRLAFMIFFSNHYMKTM